MMLKSGKVLDGAGEQGCGDPESSSPPQDQVHRPRYERRESDLALPERTSDVRPRSNPTSPRRYQDHDQSRMLGRGSLANPSMYDEWNHAGHMGRNAAQSYRRTIEPEKYDGTESLESYIERFEEVSQWNGWNPQEMAMQLSMHLVGAAKVAIKTLSSVERRSYDIICAKLVDSFGSKCSILSHQQSFWKRTKNAKETLPEFANELRLLANRAFSGMTTGRDGNRALEEMLINRFVTGLSNVELGRYVHMQHPQTLQQAVSLARDYESFDLMGGKFSKPKPYINMVGAEHFDAPLSRSSDLDEVKLSLKTITQEVKKMTDIVGGVQSDMKSLRKQVDDYKENTDKCEREVQEMKNLRINNSHFASTGYPGNKNFQGGVSRPSYQTNFRGNPRGGRNFPHSSSRGRGSGNVQNQGTNNRAPAQNKDKPSVPTQKKDKIEDDLN